MNERAKLHDDLPPFLPKRDWRPSAEREPVAKLRRENERLRKAIEVFLEDGIAEDSPDLNQVAYASLVKAFEQS